jgi:nucleoside-diphosphate-sugar epimerase
MPPVCAVRTGFLWVRSHVKSASSIRYWGWEGLSVDTIAVTGANGFLGRHCVKKALDRGVAVRGIVRRKQAAEIVEALGAEAILIPTFDGDAFRRAFEGCTGVIHVIGIVNEEAASFLDVNVQGTQRVLEGADKARVSRVVTPSGLGVDQYGERPWATNGYFWSKREIEGLCRSSPVPCVVFRPSYILGPGDELIPNLVDAILHGIVLVVETGRGLMQPLFVEDAATTFLRAALGWGQDHSVYDLVGPETITFLELISRVAAIMTEDGFDVPNYKIRKVPVEAAPEALGISREEVDVMRCDVVGDATPFTRDFQIALTPLDEAFRAAVHHVKGEEG